MFTLARFNFTDPWIRGSVNIQVKVREKLVTYYSSAKDLNITIEFYVELLMIEIIDQTEVYH